MLLPVSCTSLSPFRFHDSMLFFVHFTRLLRRFSSSLVSRSHSSSLYLLRLLRLDCSLMEALSTLLHGSLVEDIDTRMLRIFDPPLEESSKLLSKLLFEHHMAHSNSNAFETRGADAPPPLSRGGASSTLPHRLSTVERIQPDNLL